MAKYRGSYEVFNLSRVRTYPIEERPNKVTLTDLVRPGAVAASGPSPSHEIVAVADAVRSARAAGQPVLWFMGAHPIKLGLSLLIIDLMERGILTHVAGTGATAIHDFELALIGETSENVPNALPDGRFGMARETGELINAALRKGWRRGLGFGESIGRMVLRGHVPEARPRRGPDRRVSPELVFAHPEVSVLAAGVRLGIPVTIHVGIGTDIIDQHPGFDGAVKGGTSGFDFLVYTASVAKLTAGGVVLNVGSAVTGPEVLLKAVSMAANVGRAPKGIVAANFDLRAVEPSDARDEEKPAYYFRDNKSVVTRIPEAFGGVGYYIRGHFRETLPALHRLLTETQAGRH